MPAYDGFLERTKHPRLISLPGCRLLRERDDRVVLDRIEIDGSTQPIAKLDVDDLLFRGFELLLRGRAAWRAAEVKLPDAALVAFEGKEDAARA
jgi:hypothetical protein